MLKRGDVVTIGDNSFTRSIVNGKLIHENFSYDKQYVVVEVDCAFPVHDQFQSAGIASFNNTVIQAVDSDKVVFIEERFLVLVPPKHKVLLVEKIVRNHAVSGKFVEISDKLYKEIKRDS